MSNYTKSTNFTAKDSLPTGDTNKVVRGSEFDTEFNAISTAVATKADLAGPTFTGTITLPTVDINAGAIDGTTIGGSSAAAGTFTNLTASGTVNFNGATVSNLGTITTANLDGGSVDGAIIGANTAAAGTFTTLAATSATVGGSAVLTSVSFSNLDAGAVTTSGETFADSDTQLPTNASVIDYVAATIPLITEINDLSANVTWANVPNANITQSSVTQHQAALAIAATQITSLTSTVTELNLVDGSTADTVVNSKAVIYGAAGQITANELDVDNIQLDGNAISSTNTDGNIHLSPNGTGYTELRGNTNAGAIRFNCESNNHGVTLKGPPHSATATYTLELPNADGSAGQFLKTDGSGKLSFGSVDVSTKVDENHTGDVNITGELLVDSYNETFKKVSSVTTTSYYDIANATYASKSLSVSQDSTPSDILFNGDGTKAYMLGYATDAIYQYSLSTAYDMSTGSYDSVSFSVSSQDSVPLAMVWNADGTKLYVAGSGNDSIFQYTLSTAYNLATASYSSVSLDISSQTTNPDGLFFKPDGTIMYLCSQNGAVYQYTLSTAFDLSTASYASKSLDVSGNTGSARGVILSSDGLKVFIVDNTNDSIDQYNLSTAWDISTGSYASKTFSVTTQENFPMGVMFSPTGDKMYVVGTQNSTIYQYTTSFSSASTTFDCENANVFETVLDANTTVVFSNPPAAGTATDSTAYAMSLKIVQDSGASGYTVTWPTSVDWPSATAPTLTSTASAVDQFVFYTYDGGTNWYGFTAGQALG